MKERILKGKVAEKKRSTSYISFIYLLEPDTIPFPVFLGETYEYEIETPDGIIKVTTENPYPLKIGDEVEIHVTTKKVLGIFSRRKCYIKHEGNKIPVNYFEKSK